MIAIMIGLLPVRLLMIILHDRGRFSLVRFLPGHLSESVFQAYASANHHLCNDGRINSGNIQPFLFSTLIFSYFLDISLAVSLLVRKRMRRYLSDP
jgi:hypothetical protein